MVEPIRVTNPADHVRIGIKLDADLFSGEIAQSGFQRVLRICGHRPRRRHLRGHHPGAIVKHGGEPSINLVEFSQPLILQEYFQKIGRGRVVAWQFRSAASRRRAFDPGRLSD